MSLTLPALPPGPWRAQRYVGGADNWFVLSAEDRGVVGRGGPQVTEVVAVATAAVPWMLAVLLETRDALFPQAQMDQRTLRRFEVEGETTVAIEAVKRIDEVLRLAGATDA